MKKKRSGTSSEKKHSGRGGKIVRSILLLANYLFAALLLLSYLTPYADPEQLSFFAFLGLAYPALVTANFIMMVLWLSQGRRRFLLSLVTILIGYNHLTTHIGLNFRKSAPDSKEKLKIMTFNVRLFGYYAENGKTTARNRIFDFLRNTEPDILCFQEFYHKESEDFLTVDSLEHILKANHHHLDYLVSHHKVNHFGLATFTSLPIIDSGRVDMPVHNINYAIFTDVLWKDDTVRIYNVHLESIRFSREDYMFYTDLTIKQAGKPEFQESSKKILRKMNTAYKNRASQAVALSAHMQECPYPMIVCGDFNDTPNSYVYHQISGDLRDAFVESGVGLGKSYAGYFPSFRIDYILHGKEFRSHNYRTHRVRLSDHYPVSCELVKESN